MFPLISFFLSLIGLAVGTYTDFKERIIPDGVTYSLLFLGILFALASFFQTGDLNQLLITGAVILLTFLAAYLLWKLGAWAGGDVKLFTGLAALNPYNPFLLGSFFGISFVWEGLPLFRPSDWPIFMFSLFLFSIIMFIPYTAFLSLLALKDKSLRQEWINQSLSALLRSSHIILWSGFVLYFLPTATWEILPVLLILSFSPKPLQYLIAVGGAFSLFLNPALFPTLALSFLALAGISLLISWFGFAKKHVLVQIRPITSLHEGEIPGELIVVEHGKPARKTRPPLATLIKAKTPAEVMQWFIPPVHSLVLANPLSAAGLTDDQLSQLKSLVKKGELENHIRIKASAPFVPAVLLAYLLLNLLGDIPWVWWFP
ncbi:MAG: prepilin peptidase [Candidatus Diapherotrites archaeon]|nr:prepilin peptidase [Candidatus Diapherotrites archaeon]MDZ4256590.1 prepilin peptidase [archaeon]